MRPYEAGLDRAREIEDRAWQCSLLGNLGMLHANVGRMDEARRCLEQALELARALADRRREGTLLCNLGMLHLVQRHLDETIDACRSRLCVSRGNSVTAACWASCTATWAWPRKSADARRRALAYFDAGLKVMRELGDRRHEGQFLGYMGRTRARQRDYVLARECFATAHVLLSEVSDALSLGILLFATWRPAVARGDPAPLARHWTRPFDGPLYRRGSRFRIRSGLWPGRKRCSVWPRQTSARLLSLAHGSSLIGALPSFGTSDVVPEAGIRGMRPVLLHWNPCPKSRGAAVLEDRVRIGLAAAAHLGRRRRMAIELDAVLRELILVRIAAEDPPYGAVLLVKRRVAFG